MEPGPQQRNICEDILCRMGRNELSNVAEGLSCTTSGMCFGVFVCRLFRPDTLVLLAKLAFDPSLVLKISACGIGVSLLQPRSSVSLFVLVSGRSFQHLLVFDSLLAV